jgi:prepilin-type N-terminal cleavage/methylation domain-containing protein
MRHAPQKQSGFSLIELSVVLVILGLLTGGILGGQALIKAAELRKVANDFDKYETAINTFYMKYDGYPGDLGNATEYWGAVSGCPTTNAGTGTQTCNGNDDGILTNTSGDHNERLRSWQHLSNAELIEGQYAGAHIATQRYEPGVTVPRGPRGNSGFSMVGFGPGIMGFGGASGYVWGTYSCRIGLFLGGQTWDAMHAPTIFTPSEVWNLDSKLDDGRPDMGKVQTGPRTSSCVTSNNMPSEYALNTDGQVCMITYCIQN